MSYYFLLLLTEQAKHSTFLITFHAYRGAVLWNIIGCSNGPILDCTDMKSFLKKVTKSCTFGDFNFNDLAPQT